MNSEINYRLISSYNSAADTKWNIIQPSNQINDIAEYAEDGKHEITSKFGVLLLLLRSTSWVHSWVAS
jgi:hypothetical protein